MAPITQITVPANFGLEYLELASNDVTLQLSDGSLQANAVVLSLNSPVIKKDLLDQSLAQKEPNPNYSVGTENEPEPGRSSLTLDFQGFDKHAVRVFLKGCYNGILDTTNSKDIAHIHKMAHKFQVFWITQAVFDDYKNRVKRCLELYDYDNAHFLFKEAVSTLVVMKKRNFVDVFIQAFSSVPSTREEFLSLYMKNMHKYSAEELKVAVELSGSRVDIVVNALVNHIYEFKRFDTNARSILYNVNFLYVKKQYPEACAVVLRALNENRNTFEREDFVRVGIMNLKLLDEGHAITADESWNKNIELPNLFRTVSDELSVEFTQKMDGKTNQKSSSSSSCSEYFDTFDDRPPDSADSEKQDSCDDGSTDSSSSESENMSRFMEQMYQLRGKERVCNLYMFIEGLYEWIKLQGDVELGINFSEVMVIINNIRIDRGWFPISSKFLSSLEHFDENLDENQDITNLIKALKGTSSLISDTDNTLIESPTKRKYCIKTILKGKKDAKIAFHFIHPCLTDQCTRPGFCGFLFKLEKGTSGDDFRMELCYAESDYQDKSVNLHFHDNLIFAQRMHVTLAGHINGTCSFPLSWEGKPVLDDSGRMVTWGRHMFSKEDGDKSSSGTKMYDWQEYEKARFMVYYCTA